jgi:hypothetical protein
LLTLVCEVSEQIIENAGPPRLLRPKYLTLPKALKQEQDRQSEDREIVAFNPIEKLYARPVELIGDNRLADLRTGRSKVPTQELWRERSHCQMS